MDDQARMLEERDSGNYGYRTKQWQIINYKAKKEKEDRRVELFDGALGKFKKGDIEGVRPCVSVCQKRATLQYFGWLASFMSSGCFTVGLLMGHATSLSCIFQRNAQAGAAYKHQCKH